MSKQTLQKIPSPSVKNNAPENKALSNKVPENKVPGDNAPENKVPGDNAPENKVPGNGALGDKVPGDNAIATRLAKTTTDSLSGSYYAVDPAVEDGRGALSPRQFEERLRSIGEERYHDLHPFHHLLHSGKLNRGQVQAWALNRYYYQISIPLKDAALMSKMKDADIRRNWIGRIRDHDGDAAGDGGIERWYKLTDGLGLDRAMVRSTRAILPATRFAVDAYVRFVRERSLLEGITSSLTELFAPSIHKERIAGMLAHYNFISEDVMSYFRKRLNQATRDADFVLAYALEHAKTRAQQEAVCAALVFKTDVLWVMLDALHHAYVDGFLPRGVYHPEDAND